MMEKYDQALKKEPLEAESVELRLEQKKDELVGLKQNIEILQKECMLYRNCEAEYKRIYREKVKSLENSQGQGKIKYLAIQEVIKTHEANIKEIKEALLAGQRVIQALGDMRTMCTRLESLLREEEQSIGVKQYELEQLVISG